MSAISTPESGPPKARVLVVGLGSPLFERIEPLLSRTCFTVHLAPTGKDAINLCAQGAFDLTIVYHPLSDMALGDFMGTACGPDSPSAGSQLLVLTEDARIEEARRHTRKGGVVLSVDEAQTLVEEVASRLLGVTPRIARRLPIRLDVQLHEGSEQVMSHSDDVSGTGMLVRTDRSYPLGTRVTFETLLPEDPRPLMGEAEVVHHTVVGMERARGLGLRFMAFKDDGLKRLRVFLSRGTPNL